MTSSTSSSTSGTPSHEHPEIAAENLMGYGHSCHQTVTNVGRLAPGETKTAWGGVLLLC
ncbi:MAG: hypothetical protein LH630_09055 [Actinomycetia bacterium]|nr:hypothetical protein [Actinomycetes bacterium]